MLLVALLSAAERDGGAFVGGLHGPLQIVLHRGQRNGSPAQAPAHISGHRAMASLTVALSAV